MSCNFGPAESASRGILGNEFICKVQVRVELQMQHLRARREHLQVV